MPLTKVQIQVLRALASQRDPESYVAGSTPINRDGLRFSSDIDVFHDREERVAAAALNDARLLEGLGFRVTWLRQLPLIYSAEVVLPEGNTRLEWVADSDFRFFPTMRDEMFGYVLHPVDLAMNKLMAAAGRREVRDLVDLVTVHQNILPLGSVVWAAVEKSPGFTPEGLIAEIRRNSNYPVAEWRSLVTLEPLDPKVVLDRLRAALDEAESFVARMPTDKMGLLFLDGSTVVQPDPAKLEMYKAHTGQRRGQWPGSSEISTAMLERYRQAKSENLKELRESEEP